MDYLIVILGAPLLLAASAAGAGLLVDRIAGGWLPRALLVPVGFAGLVGVTQVTVTWSFLAPASSVVAALAAVIGLWVGRARLRRAPAAVRRNPGPLLAAAAAYLLAIAPVLLAGRATLPAFLLDTTAGVQLSGAAHLVEHGRDFAALPDSSYRGYLEAYFGTNYPSGSHVVLGVLGRALPTDLLWLYQPFLAFMVALSALCLWSILTRLRVPGPVAAIGAVLAAAPALVYAYALMGAIKEIAFIPVLLLLFALLLHQDRWVGRGARAAVPVGVVAAAGFGVIGLAFGAWLLLAAAIAVVSAAVAIRRGKLEWRAVLPPAALLVAVTVLLSLPTVTDAASVRLAKSLSQSNPAAAADPGNLLQPLHWFQVFGVWLHGSHRVDPPVHYAATLALATVVGVAAAFGLLALARRRRWTALAFVLGIFAVWWALTQRGTMWTDAKLIVIASPFVVALGVVGVSELARRIGRLEAAAVGGLAAVGMLLSAGLLYHDTNLAPTERFEEQQTINSEFSGQGPALLPDFDEYALFEMRDLAPASPGVARKPGALGTDATGQPFPYGSSVNLEDLRLETVNAYPLVVRRRSPERSPPPSGFVRAWAGEHYEVWKRTSGVKRVEERIYVGTGDRRTCRKVSRALAGFEDGKRLVVGLRPETVTVEPKEADLLGAWSEGPNGLTIGGPGVWKEGVDVPRAGGYRLWLKGDFGRPFKVRVDGREVGEVGYQTGSGGNYAAPVDLTLTAGRHTLELVRGGGNLAPGNGHPSVLASVVLESAAPGAGAQRLTTTAAALRKSCTRRVAWVETVGQAAGPS